jgi:hypothetical protein
VDVIARGKRLLDGFVECSFSPEPLPLLSRMAVQSCVVFTAHARAALSSDHNSLR